MTDFRFRHADLVAKTVAVTLPITAGATVDAVAPFNTDGAARIVGSCKADQTCEVIVLQGGSDDAALNSKAVFAIPAGTGEGAGDGFSCEVISRRARVKVKNTGGADLTELDLEINLRSLS